MNLEAVTEMKITLHLNSELNLGYLKMIKTSEKFEVEVKIPTEISPEINSIRNFNFPENELLINCDPKQLTSLKDIYKTDRKEEFLTLNFCP